VEPRGCEERLRFGIGEAHDDRLRSVAGEDRQEDRPELRHGHARGHRLGEHRQEDPDGVAFADAVRLEVEREGIGVGAELGVRPRPLGTVLALPDDGGGVGSGLRPAVDAHGRQVGAPADEPARPRDAGRRVEHVVVRCAERDAEEAHDGVPEPRCVVDRPAHELVERADAVLGHEPADVGAGGGAGVGPPHHRLAQRPSTSPRAPSSSATFRGRAV
jgi:hypothetical protein